MTLPVSSNFHPFLCFSALEHATAGVITDKATPLVQPTPTAGRAYWKPQLKREDCVVTANRQLGSLAETAAECPCFIQPAVCQIMPVGQMSTQRRDSGHRSPSPISWLPKRYRPCLLTAIWHGRSTPLSLLRNRCLPSLSGWTLSWASFSLSVQQAPLHCDMIPAWGACH